MTTTLYLLSGTLTVSAKGYWYTGGGEKGSFGYYPHLKDGDKPVYPDTQLHGDLRMAALWARNLGVDGAIIDRLFGKGGNEAAALLHVGDLTVAGDWDSSSSRFQVKPRIEIDDATRSVRDKMLANFEAAWLDGLTLSAPLYAGYFGNKDDAEKAQKLLTEAARLLSGFGALRSRGYGRGCVSIDLKLQPVTIAPAAAGSGSYQYSLTSLVNLRSKPVAAERRQLINTGLTITAEQLRGWFVKSYQATTGAWPTAEQMAVITMSDLIPSQGDTAAFPPPATTLRKEDGSTIEDCWGRVRKDDERGDNFVKVKEKPLKPGCFVTADGAIITVKAGIRMRNAMTDGDAGGTFTTREKGLFVQQYLSQGTSFSGNVTIGGDDDTFVRTAYAILSGLNPVINGGMLQPAIAPAAAKTSTGSGPRLVAAPLPFDPAREIKENEGVTIGTVRRYAPALGRPRRGRPVILPGSVLVDDNRPGLVAWDMFGKALKPAAGDRKQKPDRQKPDYPTPLHQLKIDWKGVTRSQAGILRELLNPDHNRDSIGKYLQGLHAKHHEKNKDSDLTKLYGALNDSFNNGQQVLIDQVREILDHLKAEVWWEIKNKKKNGAGGNQQ